MSGALDISSILQGLAASGGNVIIVNAGGGAPELPEMEDAGMPPIPAPPMGAVPPGPPGAPPMAEEPVEEVVEEPEDMMGAAKAALLAK